MTKERILRLIRQANWAESTEFSLSGEQLDEVPLEVTRLTKLAVLDLSHNKLGKLPGQIGALTALIELDLRDTELDELIPAIGDLAHLRILNLANNHLSSIPPAIGRLANLTELNLAKNPLTRLHPSLVQLNKLKKLNLSATRIEEFPKEISLNSLTELDISNIGLTRLPAGITSLTHLTVLNLANNDLTTVSLDRLVNLTELNLSDNRLNELALSICRLSKLTQLNLRGNKLTELPTEITQLTNLKKLDLRDNLLTIPLEILAKTDDPAGLINYYIEFRDSQKRSLNESKMLLVGQGSVGKTSLVKRLIENKFDPSEPKTEGINIKKWQVSAKRTKIRLNVWDFGGQEIMHATHQFFLTQRSLYLLVLDTRLGEEENRLEYWLKIIQSFGKDSPVIVVGNKTDQHPLDLDQRGLQNKYKNIKAFVDVSCSTGYGINKLRTTIADVLAEMPHIRDQLPVNWFLVKSQLELMQKDYLTYPEYVDICRKEQITDKVSQRILLGFLHDLGVVLNFQDEPRLEGTNILNPEWVTNGVYTILNSNTLIVEYKGVLEQGQLNQILDAKRYPAGDKQLFIIDIMRKFELCFDFEGGKKFLIPDLLPKEEPDTGDWSHSLNFQYHYSILPSSIMSRFIVRMNAYISQRTYWRNGVVLAYEKDNRALVKADKEDRRIFVKISGSPQGRRVFLAIIRSQFVSIHETIPGLIVEEKVPMPGHPEVVVSYNHLLNLRNLGKTAFVPEGLTEEFNIVQLLDGIQPKQERQERKGDFMDEEMQDSQPELKSELIKPGPGHQSQSSPWSSGLFYLIGAVVLLTLIAVIATRLPWYVLPVVIIGSLLVLVVVGALQLRQDQRLSQKNFLTLMIESFKRLPLLRAGGPAQEQPKRRRTRKTK